MDQSIWVDAFRRVIERGKHGSLEWALPEPWIHAELFAVLKARAEQTGWSPFRIEVPYFTYSPVKAVKGQRYGIKWADLCLINQEATEWCWFEFKVRHCGKAARENIASRSARDAFKKDVVGLLGMDIQKTASIWSRPPSYWIKDYLEEKVDGFRGSSNHFVAAYLQIGGSLNSSEWTSDELKRSISKWAKARGIDRTPEFRFGMRPRD